MLSLRNRTNAHEGVDVPFPSADSLQLELVGGIGEIKRSVGRSDIKAGQHYDIGQCWSHRSMTKEEGIEGVRLEV